MRFFRIEILQTSNREKMIVDEEIEKTKKSLDDLQRLSNRELIQQENNSNSIDWTTISEISVDKKMVF